MATDIVRQSYGLDAFHMSLFFAAPLGYLARRDTPCANWACPHFSRSITAQSGMLAGARPVSRFRSEANSDTSLSPFWCELPSLASRLPLQSLSASTAGGLVTHLVYQIRYAFYFVRQSTPRALRIFAVAVVATIALLAASPAAADICKGNIFNEAAALYHLDPDLLRAITWVESHGIPSAVGPRLPDGHRAWGAAQINDVHLPELVGYGVTQRDLLNPCVNLKLSAWVLANCIQAKGATWAAVGCYNTGPGSTNTAAQARYVRLVQRAYAGYRAQSASRTTEGGSR